MSTIYHTAALAAGQKPPNYDAEAGIHYGVISQGSVMPEAVQDVFFSQHTKDMAFESFKEEVKTSVKSVVEESMAHRMSSRYAERLANYLAEKAEDWDYIGEAAGEYEMDPRYDDGEYVIEKCLDSDLVIIKSPYFTWAPQCSPCVPNAGNLDSVSADFTPMAFGIMKEGWLKTYCLSHDWFKERQAPYPVFSVASGKQVVMRDQVAPCPSCKGTGTWIPSGSPPGECGNCAGTGHTVQNLPVEI